jgi:membrane-associated phospholipid phosphatase
VRSVQRRIAASLALASLALPCTAAADEGWWRPEMAVDYGVIAAAAGVYTTFSLLPQRSGEPLIGPRFDPAHPGAVLAPKWQSAIGKPHLLEKTEEAVPTAWMIAAIPVSAGLLALETGLPGWTSGRNNGLHVHETMVGFAEAIALTAGVTEALKWTGARLRPDFADRVQRHYCTHKSSAEVDCSAGPYVALDPDPVRAQKILDDGRKSWPSGHSSVGFALANFLALSIGGHHVWDKNSSTGARIGGATAQAALLGLAGYVAWTRVDDGRHNVSDVLTGAAIGTGAAHFAYWRRYDTAGQARRAGKDTARADWQLQALASGLSLRVVW